MPDELFPEAEVAMDSPKLAWLKRHGIVTFHLPGDLWLAGLQSWRPTVTDPAQFFCDETSHNGESRIGTGETEDDALADFCKSAEIRLWNEE